MRTETLYIIFLKGLYRERAAVLEGGRSVSRCSGGNQPRSPTSGRRRAPILVYLAGKKRPILEGCFIADGRRKKFRDKEKKLMQLEKTLLLLLFQVKSGVQRCRKAPTTTKTSRKASTSSTAPTARCNLTAAGTRRKSQARNNGTL